MKKRILRSARYLLKLVLLLAFIYGLLFLTGTARVSAGAFFEGLFSTYRGWAMLSALVLLAAVYPNFGFVSRSVTADLAADRDKILKAFAADGYAETHSEPGRMTFRASSLVRRLAAMFDDEVTVRATSSGIVMEGARKEVVRAEFRLKTYLDNESGQTD